MIDVIIPVYNCASYLRECIHSFVVQYDGTFKIILVDDGSTDDSPLICDEFADKYSFITVCHQLNGGASSARNQGIKMSNSEYILFFDSDDIINNDSIKRISDSLSKNPVEVLFFNDAHFYNNDLSTSKKVKSGLKRSFFVNGNKHRILQHLVKQKRMRVSPWSMVLKRTLIVENNLFFVESIAMEDVDWSLNVLLSAKKFNYLNCVVCLYRVRENSLSHSNFDDWRRDSLINIIQKYTNNNKINEYEFVCAYLCNFYIQLLMLCSREVEFESLPTQVNDLSWILSYGKNTRSKICYISYKFFGLKGLYSLLKLWAK